MHQTATVPEPASRILSIDVFRGLTMLLMLFVNDIGDIDLGHIRNAPAWLKHMPGSVDGMTLADVIFPCFLFIVGLSIPRALGQRLAAGITLASVCAHILFRALALVFIGLCMVNSCHGLNAAVPGMSGAGWRMLMFAGVILCWSHYPERPCAERWLPVGLRLTGAALLIYLLAIYRFNDAGTSVWMRPRWWGIIGLIGWAYLISALVWLLCRNNTTSLLGMFALFIALNIGLRYGALGGWDNLVKVTHGWMPNPRLGAYASMAIAGLALASRHLENSVRATSRRKICETLLFAGGFAVAGMFLHQPWGIHKNGGTPAWILLSLAIACAVYALLYWLVDVKRITRWTAPIASAGSNTLLMYMLPYIFYSTLSVLGIDALQTHLSEGWCGVARSGTVAVFLMGVTVMLTRMGLRLKV